MSDWTVNLIKLEETQPVPNSDFLSMAIILGYPIVFQTAAYKTGDYVIYVPPDTVLPQDPEHPIVKHMGLKPGHVVEAKRLRGIYSNGFIVPAKLFFTEEQLLEIPIMTHVADMIGVKKYDDEVDNAPSTRGRDEKDLGYMPCYTDIEGWPRYRNSGIIKEGDEVVITLKLHGCLEKNTKLFDKNGNKIKIKNIVKNNMVGLEVLGFDEVNKKIIPTKITKVFNNGKNEEWLNFNINRGTALKGKGNSFLKLKCTPNHKIYTENGYIEASLMNPGDEIVSFKEEFLINEVQEQAILGKLLGDGSLWTKNKLGRLRFSHKESDKDYIDWTNKYLGALANPIQKTPIISGFGTKMHRTATKGSVKLQEKFKDFIKDGKKVVPDWVATELGPIALAFWYMDDGSLSHNETQKDRALFATCNFTENDCKILQKGLKNLGLESIIYFSKNKKNGNSYPRIRLNKDAADLMWKMIKDYIPKSMDRKLPKKLRDETIGCFVPPETKSEFTKIKNKIISIQKIKHKKGITKYDIETETHNFFANGILVHNSNFRATHRDGRLWIGSRTRIKAEDVDETTGKEKNLWWEVSKRIGLEEKFQKLNSVLGHDQTVVFAEVYGQVQKGFHYDTDSQTRIRIFDTYNNSTKKYNDWATTEEICETMGLETVPVLHKGPWKPELEALSNGLDPLGKTHIREGFVMRPSVEKYDYRFNRIICKMVGTDYKLSTKRNKK